MGANAIVAIVGTAGSLLFVGAGLVEIFRRRGKANAKLYAAAVFFSATAAVFVCMGVTELRRAPPDGSAIASDDEATKFLAGTWTYTEPINSEIGYAYGWQKWVIREDGTADIYTALPTDDNWGNPSAVKYTVVTGKYGDTGKRYYGIQPVGSTLKLVASSVGAELHDGGLEPILMRRGDSTPFSK